MPKGIYNVPVAYNEPVKSYAPGTPEREALKMEINNLKSKTVDIPMVINGEEIRTEDKRSIHPPHEIKHTLGHYYYGDHSHVEKEIDAALDRKSVV